MDLITPISQFGSNGATHSVLNAADNFWEIIMLHYIFSQLQSIPLSCLVLGSDAKKFGLSYSPISFILC